MNLPAILCLHNSARIVTALFNTQDKKYHKGKTAKPAHKSFYWKI